MIAWKFASNEKSIPLEATHCFRAYWTTFEMLFPRKLVLPSARFSDNEHFELGRKTINKYVNYVVCQKMIKTALEKNKVETKDRRCVMGTL